MDIREKLIKFGDIDDQGQQGSRSPGPEKVAYFFVCALTYEPLNGFLPNLHTYLFGTALRIDPILVALTQFSRSPESYNSMKKHSLHTIF